MEPEDSKKAVFIKKAEGMSFADFKKVCTQSFIKAGLLSNEEKETPTATKEQIWKKEEFKK
ncbi:MAG: hypothetical protein A4E71_02561 [Smithella sp. PtaU1.Bin162]|nr:MAG: hypothetical protein A4E71_02561 [Smithella sp. PtaU1.Bin162]